MSLFFNYKDDIKILGLNKESGVITYRSVHRTDSYSPIVNITIWFASGFTDNYIGRWY